MGTHTFFHFMKKECAIFCGYPPTLIFRTADAVWRDVTIEWLLNRAVYEAAMTDNPHKRGQKDRIRINVEQFHEVQYWSRKFGCTTLELRKAVAEVGSSARAVEQELHKRHPFLADRHRAPNSG